MTAVQLLMAHINPKQQYPLHGSGYWEIIPRCPVTWRADRSGNGERVLTHCQATGGAGNGYAEREEFLGARVHAGMGIGIGERVIRCPVRGVAKAGYWDSGLRCPVTIQGVLVSGLGRAALPLPVLTDPWDKSIRSLGPGRSR